MQQRIARAVDDAVAQGISHEEIEEYRKSLLESAHHADEKLHRGILLLVSSMIGFELLTHARVTEASLGPFTLSDASILQKFFPVATAYLHFLVLSMAVFRKTLGAVYFAMTKHYNKPIYEHDLDYLILPASTLTAADVIGRYARDTASKLAGNIISFGAILVAVIGPLVFEVYAYWICFRLFGPTSISLWFSLAATVIIIFESCLMGYTMARFEDAP